MKPAKMTAEEVEQALYVLEAHSAYGAKVRAHIAALTAEVTTTKEAAAVVAQAWQEERDTLIAERDGARDMYESAEREVKALTVERDRARKAAPAAISALLEVAKVLTDDKAEPALSAAQRVVSERDALRERVTALDDAMDAASEQGREWLREKDEAQSHLAAIRQRLDAVVDGRAPSHVLGWDKRTARYIVGDDAPAPASGCPLAPKCNGLLRLAQTNLRRAESHLAAIRQRAGDTGGLARIAMAHLDKPLAGALCAVARFIVGDDAPVMHPAYGAATKDGRAACPRCSFSVEAPGTYGRVPEHLAPSEPQPVSESDGLQDETPARCVGCGKNDVDLCPDCEAKAKSDQDRAASQDARCKHGLDNPSVCAVCEDDADPNALQDEAPTGTELDGLRRVLAAQAARKAAPPPEPGALQDDGHIQACGNGGEDPENCSPDCRKAQLLARPTAPIEPTTADPLHPTGRCMCAGGGTCTWCHDVAKQESPSEPPHGRGVRCGANGSQGRAGVGLGEAGAVARR